VKDMSKSIEMRLKNIARRELLPYEMLLRFHMQNGILLRISKSQYKDNFILERWSLDIHFDEDEV